MNKYKLAEILGWYGVVALLGAYTLLSLNILTSGDARFQILNITGAIGIVIDALCQKNWQPAVLNIIWAVIGLVALVKILF